MRIGSSLNALRGAARPVVLAAGFFDGVHRGHQAIIRTVVREARRAGGDAWVLTFDRHPLDVLQPGRAPARLTSRAQTLDLFRALGVRGCVVMPFTRALARLPPEQFVARLARSAPTLRRMVIGQSWTFGRGARGTPARLRRLAAPHGFTVRIVAPIRWRGRPVSSTRIRRAVAAGRLAAAAGLLGRPYSLRGTVVRGRGLGRALGVPTANLALHQDAVPPPGIYLVRARRPGLERPGLAYFGTCPTLASRQPRARGRATPPVRVLEVHMLDTQVNVYGRNLDVEFLRKLRNERRFASLDALSRQMQRDLDQARTWFRRQPPPSPDPPRLGRPRRF